MKCERGMSCRMDVRRWLAWGAVTVLLAVWSLPAGAVGDLLEELPPELVEHIRANRPPEPDQEGVMNAFYQYLYPYDLEEEPDTWREIEHVGQIEQPGAPRSRTSVEEALADVDILFDLLKYGYAGYQMFGGDEAFGEAKKALKEDLAQESEPISAQTLGSCIREYLDFVQDGHFAVDGKTTLVRSTYLTTRDYEVRPVDEELVLYEVAGEEKRLGTLLTINHQDPQAYLKPSLNEEAEFVYRLGTQKEEPLERIELVVESVDGQTELEVPLRPGDPDYTRQPGPLYTLDEETGIPVAACRALFAFEDAGPYSAFREEDIDTFLDDAAALGEEPCLILDLRSNRGGMTGYAYQWLSRFVREYVAPAGAPWGVLYSPGPRRGDLEDRSPWAHLVTTTARRLHTRVRWGSQSGAPIGAGGSSPASPGERNPRPRGWGISDYKPLGRMVNDTVLVVLIDQYIGSAGERFVAALRDMENVVIMGYPTAGVCTTGSPVIIALPNSGLPVTLPTSVIMEPDLELREGKGFAPDFWVEPSRAVETAVQFLHRYFDCGE